MIFMCFRAVGAEGFVLTKLWLAIEHIASIRECPEQGDHSLLEMDSGKTYEVEGCAEDILREIMDVIRESRC